MTIFSLLLLEDSFTNNFVSCFCLSSTSRCAFFLTTLISSSEAAKRIQKIPLQNHPKPKGNPLPNPHGTTEQLLLPFQRPVAIPPQRCAPPRPSPVASGHGGGAVNASPRPGGRKARLRALLLGSLVRNLVCWYLLMVPEIRDQLTS